MQKRSKRLVFALLASAALVGSQLALPSAQANHGATYDVSVGADFFEQGVPGFSLRFYPQAVTVHKGDVLHFSGFDVPILLREGLSPDELFERQGAKPGDPLFPLKPDPDDGPDALSFNPFFLTVELDCGSVDNPCTWDGKGPEDFLATPSLPEIYVTITADPGDVIYAAFAPVDAKFRIKVVADNETPSTQAELDQRAAELRDADFNTALALDAKYRDRQTKHRTASGRVVWDAWAGLAKGPVETLGVYPETLRVKEGQSIMWHFPHANDAHNMVFPFKKAKQISNNTGTPVCDPDGNEGTAPDQPAEFGPPEAPPEEQQPTCPEGMELEFDIHPDETFQAGNGVLTSGTDFENSGVHTYQALSGDFFEQGPWTVKFKDVGTHRFGCTIHGPAFMGGKVIVESK